MTAPLRPRDHVRAVLVLLHLGAVLLLSIPRPPGGSDRSSLDGPVMQEIIGDWRQMANGVGWAVDQDRATDLVFGVSTGIRQVRGTVLSPFQRYAAFTGAHQSWGMFAFLKRRPALLSVEVQTGGVWQPVYLARDPDLRWRSHQLDSERFRAALNRPTSGVGRRGFDDWADWLACQAAIDFPDATALRTQLQGLQLSPPAATLRAGGVARRAAFWTTTRPLSPCGSPE